MTTFTMQDLNNIPVTKEEEEAMQALEKPTQEAWVNYGVENCTPPTLPTPLSPEAIIDEMVTQFSLKLKLLASVIKEKGTNVPSEGAEKSLQECVDTTLQQAEWLKEMVDRKVDELLDDKDFAYEINSEVEDWFSNSFSLDDHVDIEAEVESKVEEILDRMVDERLAELVEEKLQNASISISF